MYKHTSASSHYLKRAGSSAVTPRLSAAKEDKSTTGGGADQLADGDGQIEIEGQRLDLLKRKAEVDHKCVTLKNMLADAKYKFQCKGIASDPRVMRKWQHDIADLGALSQKMQMEISYLNKKRAIENNSNYMQRFIMVARCMLHPDVFAQIDHVAQSARQFQTIPRFIVED